MYIQNFKVNIKKILIVIAILAIVIALFIEIGNRTNLISSKKYDYELNDANYTTILKSVHDNIDKNIGKTIKLSGFIFKLPDFESGYFVCGRNMIYSDDEKVVGFLCKAEKSLDLNDSEWVEITGVFEKGFYMSDMPIIKVNTIKKITAPANTFVEAPDFLN